MWPFGRKAKRTAADSHLARPIRLVDPVTESSADGGMRMKVRLTPGRWNRWIFRLPDGMTKTFELDPIGVAVWDNCDGKTTVQQIVRRVASKYKLNLREAEVSTTLFLRTLIRKGLVGMPMREGDRKQRRKPARGRAKAKTAM